MHPIRPSSIALTEQAAIEKMRGEARGLLGALTERLAEVERTAASTLRFDAFAIENYAAFKDLFLKFRTQCEEFQALSHLTQGAITRFEASGRNQWRESTSLQSTLHQLQVPLLRAVVRANLRLLRVWEDRLAQESGLPIGAHEMFRETVHTIHLARTELLRPRYLALLEDDALDDAERTEVLLRKLLSQAPALFNFTPVAAPPPAADPWARLNAIFLKLRRRH